MATINHELLDRLSALLEITQKYQAWFKAVPEDVAASFSNMPEIDGELANEVISAAQNTLHITQQIMNQGWAKANTEEEPEVAD